MKKLIATTAISAALTLVPVSGAFAQTTVPPSDPNDVQTINNPLDENDDGGFNDWGLLGLLGLAGLAGLKRRDSIQHTNTERVVAR